MYDAVRHDITLDDRDQSGPGSLWNKMLPEMILFVVTETTLSHASHHNLFLGYLGQPHK